MPFRSAVGLCPTVKSARNFRSPRERATSFRMGRMAACFSSWTVGGILGLALSQCGRAVPDRQVGKKLPEPA